LKRQKKAYPLVGTLGAFRISPSDLAERTGCSGKTINEIIEGKTSITTEISLELEKSLGVPASFWNNRESHYRDAQNRKSQNHTSP